MVRKRARKSRSKNIFQIFLNKYVFTSQTLPLVFVLSTIGILFVLIRMKGIEQDYKFNELAKKIKFERIHNKQLKANRAKLLSIKKLEILSKKYNLREPNEKHIIIIP